MRHLILIGLMLTVAAVSSDAQTHQGALISIEKTVHDFGRLKQGTVKEHKFIVKNTGKAPLKLREPKADCGCTLVDYTKSPIMPGKTGFVSAKMNTRARRPGAFNKGVTIYSNGGTVVCRIKGTVIEAETKTIRK